MIKHIKVNIFLTVELPDDREITPDEIEENTEYDFDIDIPGVKIHEEEMTRFELVDDSE